MIVSILRIIGWGIFCDSRDCKAQRESVKRIDVLMEYFLIQRSANLIARSYAVQTEVRL